MKLGIFGGTYSHTDEASLSFFVRSGAEVQYYPEIEQVFAAVHSGGVDCGIVPSANTNGGPVVATIQASEQYPDVRVVEEKPVRIIQNLGGLRGSKLSEITEVYSHPQALSQCTEWLDRNLPHVERIPMNSTVAAAEFVLRLGDKTHVCICSKRATKPFGVVAVASGIESKGNVTTFVLLRKN